jgi:hypothetical protein
MLWYKKCICVPKVKEIRELILSEAHGSTYSIHPGSAKMYHDLKSRYWWYGMKRVIAEYVALCDNCQSQSKMPETYRTFTTIEDTSMEVGRNKYGFHYRVTDNKIWL